MGVVGGQGPTFTGPREEGSTMGSSEALGVDPPGSPVPELWTQNVTEKTVRVASVVVAGVSSETRLVRSVTPLVRNAPTAMYKPTPSVLRRKDM